jgi:hypothetical protein
VNWYLLVEEEAFEVLLLVVSGENNSDLHGGLLLLTL